MEELLNKLIKRGWKPFWIRWEETRIKIERNEDLDMQIFKLDWIIIEQHHRISWSLRNLTSKESWLWQFVCENKLVNKYADISDEEEAYIWKWKSWLDAIDINWDYIRLDDDYDEYHQDTDYKYWLIESALKDESELEEFLLDNIKV